MTVKTTRYVRKPFDIDAVQVTEENIADVAAWCQGNVRTAKEGKYVKVRVHRPLTPKQTQAFVSDWVLYAGNGFKVYTDNAFHNSFVLPEEVSVEV